MPTISLWLTVAYRVAIAVALVWLVYRIEQVGADRVKAQDMLAVQRQIDANAKIAADNERRRVAADAQHDSDLLAIHAAVAARSEPIIVRVPSSTGPVSGNTGPAKGDAAKGGPTDSGPGGGTCDVRASVSEFETKYETALADCRDALSQWPSH